jgi:microcystin degradation protein MlrC
MTVEELANLCKSEFTTLIEKVEVVDPRRKRIRLTLFDGSFIDIHQNSNGRYSYHWECDGVFYRFNNAPHFDEIETAPHHLHISKQVVSSQVRGVTEEDVRKVLKFVHLRGTN